MLCCRRCRNLDNWVREECPRKNEELVWDVLSSKRNKNTDVQKEVQKHRSSQRNAHKTAYPIPVQPDNISVQENV